MVPVLEVLPPRISSAVGKRLIAANGDVPLLMGSVQRMVQTSSCKDQVQQTLATAECIGKSLDVNRNGKSVEILLISKNKTASVPVSRQRRLKAPCPPSVGGGKLGQTLSHFPPVSNRIHLKRS